MEVFVYVLSAWMKTFTSLNHLIKTCQQPHKYNVWCSISISMQPCLFMEKNSLLDLTLAKTMLHKSLSFVDDCLCWDWISSALMKLTLSSHRTPIGGHGGKQCKCFYTWNIWWERFCIRYTKWDVCRKGLEHMCQTQGPGAKSGPWWIYFRPAG